MQALKKTFIRLLEKTLDDYKADNTYLSETEMIDIMSMLCHQALSKESACKYLNISRSRFDDLVREGKLPKGIKRTGFKELIFYKDELDQAIKKIRDERRESK